MNQTLNRTIAAPEPVVLQRQIGSTVYNIGIHLNPEAKETLDDKVRRLLINDLQCAPENATIKPLQAGWLSERGSA